ncbi:MAG: FHA domain-containing protein, partial [Planctomycetaceae bacterium]|nr:FHA domain-containing protein [Planctomycetaceae bacterium]
MLGELVPCGGGDPIPLLKQKLLVGRRSNCDIQLEFHNVSGQHCQLELLNGYWY